MIHIPVIRGPAVPFLVAGIAVALVGQAAAQPAAEQHQQAAEALAKLGAKVKTEKAADGTAYTFVSCYEKSFVSNWKGTQADLKHLKGLTNLKSLYIRLPGVTDEGLQHLKDLTTLKALDLHTCQITDAGLKHLQGLADLEFLSLASTGVTSAGLKHLNAKNLVNLELSLTQVTEVNLDDFPKLKHLHLGSLKTASIRVKEKSVLESLSFYHTPVAALGLADLVKLTMLAKLDFTGAGIGNAELEPIKSLTRLKELDLRGDSKVTDAGMAHLNGLTGLEILRLGGTQVTDAGMVHLAGLKNLLRLELDDTQVTDAGLEHLAMLPKLCYLSYYSTKITGQGLHKLKKSLPNLIHP